MKENVWINTETAELIVNQYNGFSLLFAIASGEAHSLPMGCWEWLGEL